MKQVKKCLPIEKRKQGFTLVEVLIVVAILAILFSVVVGNLVSMQRKLRQQELDAKAEIIYAAAQNRMAELRAAGYAENAKPDDPARKIATLSDLPADVELQEDDDRVFYWVSSVDKTEEGAFAGLLLPDTAVSAELWGKNWIIEYDGKTGQIYAVFYSAQELPTDEVSRNGLRTYANRLRGGANVGYYGGDLTNRENTNVLMPTVSIENKEKLTATFYCISTPVTEGKTTYYPQLKFYVSFRDLGTDAVTPERQILNVTKVGDNLYKAQMVLDSLEAEDGGRLQFYKQFPELTPGNNFQILFRAEANSDYVDDSNIAHDESNGLFAYKEQEKDKDGNFILKMQDTARIEYRRHLQNLDSATSHVYANITNALLINDLNYRKAEGETADCFYPFKSITNANLQQVDGKDETSDQVYAIHNLYVAQSGNAGLFATFSGTEIRNLTLSNTRVAPSASYAGAVAGMVTGKTTLRNVRVDLTNLGAKTYASPAGVPSYIQGGYAGGLVGAVAHGASLTVEGCAAATNVTSSGSGASNGAGGAVGIVWGELQFQKSYTDCYLRAVGSRGQTGGVAAAAAVGTVTAEDFYTAGYQTAATAAGVIPGTLANTTLTRGYSVTSYTVPDDGVIFATVTSDSAASARQVYSTAPVSSDSGAQVVWCHVAPDGGSSPDLVTGDSLSSTGFLANLGSSFRIVTGSTTPYNLLDQGLNSYPYPRIAGLSHYGDWEDTPSQFTWVYFEKYADGKYGVYGSGLKLDNSKEILGDGYGILMTERPGNNWQYQVIYQTASGQTSRTFTDWDFTSRLVTITSGGRTYYLLPVTSTSDPAFGKLIANNIVREDGSFYYKVGIRCRPASYSGPEPEIVPFWFNPYFAKTVIAGNDRPGTPSTVYLRTPRHLKALSGFYAPYDTTENAGTRDFPGLFDNTADRTYTFLQERTINWAGSYDWNGYADISAPSAMAPIGSDSAPFRAVYDGQGLEITNTPIESGTLNVGLFGCVGSAGQLRNVVLTGCGTTGVSSAIRYKNATTTASGTVLNLSSDRLYQGTLAAKNRGTIVNCAVAGYRTQAAAFSHSAAYIGGLVGLNSGTIEDSTADTPTISLRFTNASGTVGGLVAVNQSSGVIRSCYASGHIEVTESKESTVTIAGFAGENSGSLRQSYAGCALEAAGTVGLYGFAPRGTGGCAECYYLDNGTYSYSGVLYSFNYSNNDYKDSAVGEAVNSERLMELDSLGQAVDAAHTLHSHRTTNVDSNPKAYEYPAVVTQANGSPVHYGNWATRKRDFGILGVFYWEYEEGGPNAGYHLSYLGTSRGEPIQNSTLCRRHDDGGVVKSYGYGYFFQSGTKNGSIDQVTLIPVNCELGEQNKAVVDALQALHSQYQFVAYTTGTEDSRLHLVGSKQNATWLLTYGGNTYTYSVSPFFANAMSLDGYQLDNETNQTSTGNSKPGTAGNPYEIRSVQQLQFINWNYYYENTSSSIVSLSKTSYYDWDARNWRYEDEWNSNYTYLLWGNDTNSVSGKYVDLYWNQSHDLDAVKENFTGYTPIGSMYDQATEVGDSKAEIAAFASTYDGSDYTIKNVKIESSAECVGLFGITSGAKMSNIVLYADNEDAGQVISNSRGVVEWYCVGGLVGFAGNRGDGESQFENCTVSGYTIRDQRTVKPGWGGGCVGGLVGATNMNLSKCSAVTTIVLDLTYNEADQNCRVGGLVGAGKGTITNCYAGGEIKAGTKLTSGNGGTRVWIGGIVGGIVLRNTGTLQQIIGATSGKVMTVSNSYSYVQLPEKTKAIKGIQAIASNGDMQTYVANVDKGYDYVVINNSYALDTAVQSSDDYKGTLNETNFMGINLNRGDMRYYAQEEGQNVDNIVDYWYRRIEINNSIKPYLTYEEMAKELGDHLGGDFGTVTTTDPETQIVVPGKYSYPGTDSVLRNLQLNYPFPTILTQTDITTGSTISVHYGAWPTLGLYWESADGEIDLLADRVVSTAAENAADGETKTAAQPESGSVVAAEPEAKADTGELAQTESEAPAQESEGPVSQAAAQEAEAPAPQPDTQDEAVPDAQAGAEDAEAPADPAAAPAENAPESGGGEDQQKRTVYVSQKDFVLKKVNVTGAGSQSTDDLEFEYWTEDGSKEIKEDALVKVTSKGGSYLYQSAGIYATNVTIQACRPGTIVVRAIDGKYQADMTITVTANLEIRLEESSVQVYEEDTHTVGVTLVNTKDEVLELEDSQLTWTLPASSTAASWTIAADAKIPGRYLLTVTGGKAGPKAVSPEKQVLSVRYRHDAQTTEPAEANARLTLTVKPGMVLGIANGKDYGVGNGEYSADDYRQLSVPHTPVDRITEAGPLTEDDPKPVTLEDVPLYLYLSADQSGNDYITLDRLPIQKVSLLMTGEEKPRELNPISRDDIEAAIQAVESEEERRQLEEKLAEVPSDTEFYLDEAYVLTVSGAQLVPNGGSYRELKITDLNGAEPETNWTLELTLGRRTEDTPEGAAGTTEKQGTFYLSYQRPNAVRFLKPNQETDRVLLVRYLSGHSKGFDDPEALNDLLRQMLREKGIAAPEAPGMYWSWEMPGALTENVDVEPRAAGMPFTLKFDANFPDSIGYGGEKPDLTVTYGETIAEDALASIWTRPGYTFAGWIAEVQTEGVPVLKVITRDTDGMLCADGTPYVPQNAGETLTLAAQWKMTYTLTLADPRGEGNDSDVLVEGKSYPLPERSGTESITFRGWKDADGGLHPAREQWTYTPAKTGETVTLTAVWEISVTLRAADGTKTETTVQSDGSLPAAPAGAEGWALDGADQPVTIEELLKQTEKIVLVPYPVQSDEEDPEEDDMLPPESDGENADAANGAPDSNEDPAPDSDPENEADGEHTTGADTSAAGDSAAEESAEPVTEPMTEPESGADGTDETQEDAQLEDEEPALD